jgi:anti-anti-sigma factor
MSALSRMNPAAPVSVTDTAHSPPEWINHSARFTAESHSSRVVVSAHGELDASNASQLADYVESCAAHSTSLIVDLSNLKFFGTAGFSALHLIDVRCAAANLRWAVLPGKAVSRLLRICDPEGTLPLVASAHAPLADDENPEPNGLFQLIP